MRITFVAPRVNLSGGIRVIAIHAERLRQRGHEVLVVAPPNRRPRSRKILRSLLSGRGWPKVPRVNPSHFESTDIELRLLDRFRPVTDADVPDADVVVATWWETAEWVAALSARKGTKVHFMQDYEVWGHETARVDATCRHPMPKIVIAGWVKKLLCERFGAKQVTLVPDSVDLEMFYASPRGKQSQPTVGLAYNPFLNKGCDIMLRAYELARQRVPDLRLLTFAKRPPVPEMPVPDDCEFILQPSNEELRQIYARCDAWLFGTRIEGFGLPLLEAMACRTPVIGTPAGAAPELLVDGTGILVRPEDPEDMAEAIVRICKLSDSEWRVMSEAAYAKASCYTWDDAADRFEQALLLAIENDKDRVPVSDSPLSCPG